MAMRLVFAAGGTGGHLFPALAVAERIRRDHPDAAITFVGTRGKIEERIVPAHGFALRLLWIGGIDRKRPWKSAMLPIKVVASILRMIALLRSPRASVAVCAGSYVSYPVGIAARLLRIPLVLMESNVRPGLVVARLAPRASRVHVAFEASKEHFTRTDNVRVSGNPVREELAAPMPRAAAAAVFGLDGAKKTLLVFGGSLGARTINAAVARGLDALHRGGVQVIWQTGAGNADVAGIAPAGVWRGVFIDDMRAAYAASDVAVCRAGGTTVAELAAVGMPALLVPYPHHADRHQVRNAEALERAGAAVMVDDVAAGERLVAEAMALLADDARCIAMRAAAKRIGKLEATATIANDIVALAHGDTERSH